MNGDPDGRAYRSDLGNMPLQFGDAFLLYGPREKMSLLDREPDFLLLEEVQEAPRLNKALLAAIIMLAVVGSVLLELVPLSVAAIVGAVLMVLTRCFKMEEAYRQIDWRAVFLIAGMLPLGIARHGTKRHCQLPGQRGDEHLWRPGHDCVDGRPFFADQPGLPIHAQGRHHGFDGPHRLERSREPGCFPHALLTVLSDITAQFMFPSPDEQYIALAQYVDTNGDGLIPSQRGGDSFDVDLFTIADGDLTRLTDNQLQHYPQIG